MYKKVLFTHDDMDGAGCRIVFELAHRHLEKGKDYEIFNCSNNGVDETALSIFRNEQFDPVNTHVIFADICCSVQALEVFKSKEVKVDIFDHHRTNFPVQQVYPDAQIVPENVLGVQESGTSLLYQYFYNIDDFTGEHFKNLDEVMFSKLVDTIRSYDTYEWKTTNNILAKELQTLFYLLGMDKFCERYIKKISDVENKDNHLISLTDMDFVSTKIENEQKVIDNFTPDDVFEFMLRGYNIAFILTTKGASISELGYQFLTKYPQYDAMIYFSPYNGGKFEMRTVRDDIDMGAMFAMPIGGGGHPKAAGAPLPQSSQDMMVDMLIDVLNGRF